MRFEPHRAVRNASVGHRMRLAEAKRCKVGDQLPCSLGVVCRNRLLCAALEEALPQPGQFVVATLLQRTAEQVGFGEIHARQKTGRHHHVFLVQQHAVRQAQGLSEARMRRMSFFCSAGAPDVGVLHAGACWAGANQRHRLDHMIHGARVHLLQQVPHARRLDLKASQCAAFRQAACSGRVFFVELLQLDALSIATDAARLQCLGAVIEHRQGAIAQ